MGELTRILDLLLPGSCFSTPNMDNFASVPQVSLTVNYPLLQPILGELQAINMYSTCVM